MVYAYLQLARDAEARRAIDEAMKVSGHQPALRRAVCDRRDAGALRVRARRVGARRRSCSRSGSTYPVRRGDHVLRAQRSAPRAAATSPRRARTPQQLEALHKALLDAKNTYWATEVEVQRLAAAGWIALGEGKSDEALKFMRAAADLEDRTRSTSSRRAASFPRASCWATCCSS